MENESNWSRRKLAESVGRDVHEVAASTRRRPPTASRIFEAEFAGECDRCAGRIEPGDKVRYVDDVGLVHALHASSTPRSVEICDQCHMTMPCECGDE